MRTPEETNVSGRIAFGGFGFRFPLGEAIIPEEAYASGLQALSIIGSLHWLKSEVCMAPEGAYASGLHSVDTFPP